jgi:1-deoxy-D-xylulose-5-phosphate reductoisomerase
MTTPDFSSIAPKKLAILGSTGSIGTNCLDVVSKFPGLFRVESLSTNLNADMLLEQVKSFRPSAVVVCDRAAAERFESMIEPGAVELFTGREGLLEMVRNSRSDFVVNGLTGAVGLEPTLEALRHGKRVALANKESLVIGGELVMNLLEQQQGELLPVDSEHSAIWSCLEGRPRDHIRRIILTASGGPFRELDINHLPEVTIEDALEHPTWKMGKKISIDSATLMNKGLEIIEAYWLFGIDIDRIEVIVHPESIIHSMVEFIDGSILAQMSIPDMRQPIQKALFYPEKVDYSFIENDLLGIGRLSFQKPDLHKFPCLSLARDALKSGGTCPAVLNAANEIAVARFLEKDLHFMEIPSIIEKTLEAHTVRAHPTLETIMEVDGWARDYSSRIRSG